jgi:hypothetical protein
MRKFPDNLQPKIPYTINYGGLINRLEHIALNYKELSEPVDYYEAYFVGKSTPMCKGGNGRNFVS